MWISAIFNGNLSSSTIVGWLVGRFLVALGSLFVQKTNQTLPRLAWSTQTGLLKRKQRKRKPGPTQVMVGQDLKLHACDVIEEKRRENRRNETVDRKGFHCSRYTSTAILSYYLPFKIIPKITKIPRSQNGALWTPLVLCSQTGAPNLGNPHRFQPPPFASHGVAPEWNRYPTDTTKRKLDDGWPESERKHI